jgi:hypothetical protein
MKKITNYLFLTTNGQAILILIFAFFILGLLERI